MSKRSSAASALVMGSLTAATQPLMRSPMGMVGLLEATLHGGRSRRVARVVVVAHRLRTWPPCPHRELAQGVDQGVWSNSGRASWMHRLATREPKVTVARDPCRFGNCTTRRFDDHRCALRSLGDADLADLVRLPKHIDNAGIGHGSAAQER